MTPDYIVNNWTEELLEFMIEKLVERKKRETKAMQSASGDLGGHKVPDSTLFARASHLIKIVKKGTGA